MPFITCCISSCQKTKYDVTLFQFTRNETLQQIWLKQVALYYPEGKNLTPQQLIQRKICIRHFEQKYLNGNKRLYNACPTLISEEEITTGIPKNPVNLEVLSDETSTKATTTLDHSYCKNPLFDALLSSSNENMTTMGILGQTSQESTSALSPTEPENFDYDDPPMVDSPEDIGTSNFETPAIIETSRKPAKESDSAVENVSGKTLTVIKADKLKLAAPVTSKIYGTLADKPRLVKQDIHAIINRSKKPVKESDSAVQNVSGKTLTVIKADKLIAPVTNKTYGTPADKTPHGEQVIQLRLINDDGLCYEPIYGVDKKQTATPTAVQNPPSRIKDSPSKESDVQIAPPVPERTEATRDKYKNKEYWKLKLKHILHNTQFCGVCLEADADMNALTDVLEITDDERTYKKSLTDIVHKVFNEGGYCPASSQVCNNCTKKLIQSYMFINNAEETSKMLDLHLEELYTKTCYVRNNSLKDAMDAHSKIYNVVIALDNKGISENFESSQIKTEKPESHQNEKDEICDKRKLRCVSCNVVLPSYRAWKTHERTVHKQSHRCRICLQSYKTQRALTTHYKTHLKSRCTLCHRTVQDGELLQHLNTRHKHSIHLCTTCNVAFYSAKALGSHIKECHRREDSKCVTCLQSLSQVELERHQCRFKCPECEEAPCVHHRHLMWYREQMANLAPRAKCAECRYVCTSKEALVAHVNRQHLSLQPHRCASCGHHFYCKSHLNKHICTSEKRYKDLHMCQYCDKAFSSLCVCKQHEKGCVAIQRKYRCDDCPANFDSSKDHMKHIKLKHGKEVLSCRLCDRVFLNDLKRTRHERQAHGEQRGRASLVCVVCQTEFSSRAALELHIRYHGPDANCQLDTLGQFKSHKHRHRRSMTMCEVCGVVISRILFKKHMTAHSKVTVSCKTCGKSFQNSTLLRYHQSVHVKSAPCPRCKKLFSSAKLWRHYRNHLIRDSLHFQVSAIHGL